MRSWLQLEAHHRVGESLGGHCVIRADLHKAPAISPVAPYDVDGERIRIGSKALRLSVGIQAGGGYPSARDYSALTGLVAVWRFGGGIGPSRGSTTRQQASCQHRGQDHAEVAGA